MTPTTRQRRRRRPQQQRANAEDPENRSESHVSSSMSGHSTSLSSRNEGGGMSVCGESVDGSGDIITASDNGKLSLNNNSIAIKQIEYLAKSETQNVQRWRCVLLVLMLFTSIGVSFGTYIILQKQQHQERLASYSLFVQTVERSSIEQLHDFTLAMNIMSESITAAGQTQQQHRRGGGSSPSGRLFPFVRIPMYEVLGSHIRHLSSVEYVAWSPLVQYDELDAWSKFVQSNKHWYDESTQLAAAHTTVNTTTTAAYLGNASLIRDYVWYGNRSLEGNIQPTTTATSTTNRTTTLSRTMIAAPIWQCSPPPYSPYFMNYDLLSESYMMEMIPSLRSTRSGLMSRIDAAFADLPNTFDNPQFQDAFHTQFSTDAETNVDHPHSTFVQPVFDQFFDRSDDHDDASTNSSTSNHNSSSNHLVGIVTSVVAWDGFMSNLLPEGVRGIVAVLHNNCNQSYTYTLDGKRAASRGAGSLHQTKYGYTKYTFPLVTYTNNKTLDVSDGHCIYSISLYFSDDFYSVSVTNRLKVFCTVALAMIFTAIGIVFAMYDHRVRQRNVKLIGAAARSNAIISSLFPTQVRERLFANDDDNERNNIHGEKRSNNNATQLQRMMHSGEYLTGGAAEVLDNIKREDEYNSDYRKSKPIADLFPETTVLFADIAGFTAWSSVREPSQVFILLETLFRAFDTIAKRRRVFKVETVGDCYVAVTGLPEPHKDHAVAMARFARDCMRRMQVLVKKLEVTLGPDTADLALRIGIHSGPVTAGVLRSDRSRFQLFGDTMNTAARMESHGLREQVQLSQDTAELLIAAGKENWITRREDAIMVKGKGEMRTYWLKMMTRTDRSSVKDTTCSSDSPIDSVMDVDHYDDYMDDLDADGAPQLDAKTQRLVNWNVDILLRLLQDIVASRRRDGNNSSPLWLLESKVTPPNESMFTSSTDGHGTNPLEEVKEIITLPKFKTSGWRHIVSPTPVVMDGSTRALDPKVVRQLRDYVSRIAKMYRPDNPFHNFEHASHVAMSVSKLLSRIVAPPPAEISSSTPESATAAATLHDHTYGITSDPLTQFSCVLSALIHDVDHAGVPNAQLVLEGAETAQRYHNQSVAEQNSVDLAWELLFGSSDYTDLRNTIYTTHDELLRFRQIVVNAVMATDIVDPDLKRLRNQRWDRAFSETHAKETAELAQNRKATIVIEHLIQASDVSHTMQHWHVYRKWNERFFAECYKAYMDGRATRNPADNWYEGEMGFFDFYIIPLAKKLKDCGVFGVSSDEYLNYAMQNRQEWEQRGRDVVHDMVAKICGSVVDDTENINDNNNDSP